jgi:hypothetical protein
MCGPLTIVRGMRPMAFVVAATSKTGNVSWLAVVDERGFHTLGTRGMAEIFPSLQDAQSAISHLLHAFVAASLTFSIESAD